MLTRSEFNESVAKKYVQTAETEKDLLLNCEQLLRVLLNLPHRFIMSQSLFISALSPLLSNGGVGIKLAG